MEIFFVGWKQDHWKHQNSEIFQIKNIGLGGVACCHATMYVHPIETAMVQQQLVPTGKQIPPLPSMLGKMVRTEGISGWYRGITASLLREMVYSSLRFGLYEPFRDAFAKIGPVSIYIYM